ncbi:MAG: peptide deformylase [Clostridia bacterium]|nr:peptide deformylase [Clostridia bacterium]
MVKDIIHDPIFLGIKSAEATADDLAVAADLLDTLAANSDRCVGMAANMIGVSKRIIVFDNCGKYMTMFNPQIVKKEKPYDAEEGCLSLSGTRKTKRFGKIKVKFQNEKMQTRMQVFEGWTAEIIQHEVDHCDGILI